MTQLTVLPSWLRDGSKADVLLFPETHTSHVSGIQFDDSRHDSSASSGSAAGTAATPAIHRSGVTSRGPNDPPSSSRFKPRRTLTGEVTGHDKRLAELLREQHRAVWCALRRLGVPIGLLDDATQEVFIIVSRKLDHIAPDSMRSFLYGTALRVAANFRRSRQARQHDSLENAEAGTLQPQLDAEHLVHQKQLRELLDQILDSLSDDLREVFVLSELERLTRIEISELLGLPAGTIASRLRRAREQFEDACERLRSHARGGLR